MTSAGFGSSATLTWPTCVLLRVQPLSGGQLLLRPLLGGDHLLHCHDQRVYLLCFHLLHLRRVRLLHQRQLGGGQVILRLKGAWQQDQDLGVAVLHQPLSEASVHVDCDGL